MLAICVKAGRDQRLYYFDKQEITIGRTEENDLVLVDERVSKRHCQLLQRNPSYYIFDLKSTNGTFLNQKRISGCAIIGICDQVRVGDHVLWITSDLAGTLHSDSLRASRAATPAVEMEPYMARSSCASRAPMPPGPSVAFLRTLLEQKLPIDSQLDAFCLDHFSEVKHQFACGMDRTTKLNILLERADHMLLWVLLSAL